MKRWKGHFFGPSHFNALTVSASLIIDPPSVTSTGEPLLAQHRDKCGK